MYDNVTFARTETCLLMEPHHSNPMGHVHGGELMKIMDNVAGITAFRHVKGDVVTARVDEIVFHKPVNIGDIVTFIAQLTYVGKSSLQIMVRVFVEDVHAPSRPDASLTAFFTMVHMLDGKPSPTPKLVPVTAEDEILYGLGEKKYLEIRSRF